MLKLQHGCVQEHPPQTEIPCLVICRLLAIAVVSCDWKAEGCRVCADLMRTSCVELNVDQGPIGLPPTAGEFGPRSHSPLGYHCVSLSISVRHHLQGSSTTERAVG